MMMLGMLLTAINECEFITVFDANGDVIVEDQLNNFITNLEVQPYWFSPIIDVDTGISSSNGSLHAVIGITINDVIKEED
ncbi:TPA: hypothetical protein ACHIWU_000857 [Enterococcus faecium]